MRSTKTAFTLVEILIGLVIVGFLGAVMLYGLFNWTDSSRLEKTKISLRNQAEEAVKVIELDLQQAVKTRGALSDAVTGIYRRTSTVNLAPERVGTENDGVVIYKYWNRAFSLGIAPINAAGLQVSVTTDILGQVRVIQGDSLTDPSVLLAVNAKTYFTSAVAAGHRLFILSSDEAEYVVEGANPIAPPPGDLNTMNFQFNGNLTGRNGNNLDNLRVGTSLPQEFRQGGRLVTATRVDYFVDANNRLIRTEQNSDTFPQEADVDAMILAGTARVILNNVSQFRIDYQFANRRSTQADRAAFGQMPQAALSHPREQWQGNPANNLRWSDIAGVDGSIQFRSAEEIPDGLQMADASAYEAVGSFLQYTVRFSNSPVNYEELLRNSVDGDPAETCSEFLPGNRCTIRCASKFLTPPLVNDPNDPRWEGWGRHIGSSNPSDRCACGTDPVARTSTGDYIYRDPTTPTGFQNIARWSSNSSPQELNRLNACHRVYNLTVAPWDTLHPMGGFMWNNCFYGNRADWINDANFTQGTALWASTDLALDALAAGNDPGPAGNRLRCDTQWPACEGSAAWFRTGRFEAATDGTLGGFAQKCQCLTRAIDENGNTTTQRLQIRNWPRVCSDDVVNGCSVLYNGRDAGNNPIFRIFGDDDGAGGTFAQGLTVTDAAYCTCRNTILNNVEGVQDFRANAQLAPLDPTTNNPPTQGSITSTAVTVRTTTNTIPGLACTQAEFDTSNFHGIFSGYSACVQAVQTPAAWGALVPAPLYGVQYSGYCSDRCIAQPNVIQSRLIMFGVANVNELPPSCQPPPNPLGPGGFGGE